MSIETQLAIKRNAEELNSYLKDLNSWTSEIKKKDVLAKKTKVKKHNYPPIRNTGKIDSNSPPSSRPSSPMPEEKSNSDNKPVKKEVKKERIKSYDYRSWDKYNVEEELERLENEDYKEPKPMVEEKEEDDINQEAIELSLIEKEKGNVMFKKGNYKRAIQYYTKSKELDPTNPVFPLNRAMAYLKLKKYSEAENDCTDCIALSPKNVKALYRRGLARVGLKKYLEAKADFEAAVVLEPSNKQAKDELNKVLAILKPKPKEESKPSSPINNKSSTSSTSKSTQLKKKKSTITKEQEEKLKNKPVRRRLQITEVGRTQEEIQKQHEEELLKQMNEDIKEIKELMENSENDNKLNEISLTDNIKEDNITPLDMVPVSTTKTLDKTNNNNNSNNSNKSKSSPKKIEIVEKEEIVEEEKKEEKNDNDKNIIEIKENETETTQVKTEPKRSNELLSGTNNKSALLSSFILNKENEEKKSDLSKNETTEIKEQKKSNLNKKRSIVIEEVDEIIGETIAEPLKPINEIPIIEEVKKEANNAKDNITSPKIVPIIEEVKKEMKIEEIEIPVEKIPETEKKDEQKKIEDETKKEIVEEKQSTPKKIRSKVKVATTMYDFERDWKSMRNDDYKTFEYLSSIIPENLPSLFKNSLESDYLTRILIIMNKFYIEESMFDEMYALLDSLHKVNRFEMTLMFMSRKDKQALKTIFDAMKSNEANSKYSMSDLEKLAKNYKMTL